MVIDASVVELLIDLGRTDQADRLFDRLADDTPPAREQRHERGEYGIRLLALPPPVWSNDGGKAACAAGLGCVTAQ